MGVSASARLVIRAPLKVAVLAVDLIGNVVRHLQGVLHLWSLAALEHEVAEWVGLVIALGHQLAEPRHNSNDNVLAAPCIVLALLPEHRRLGRRIHLAQAETPFC